MADIYTTAKLIFKWEGGFSNHPNDSGGATMMGVTIGTYKEYCRRKGKPTPTVEDLKKITRVDAIEVLRALFWVPLKGDLINNQSVADLIVDNCWGSGLGYVRTIQRVIGTTADGVVGPKTIAMLNGWNQRQLHAKLVEARRVFYNNICQNNPKNKVFLKGWLNRLNDFKFKP